MDESLGAALEAAAARQRKSVVGRREGLPTKVLEGLGDIPMNMVGSFKNMMDAAYSHQPGTSIQDDPQYAGLVTENALNLIGVPALTGGVPASALGSAARRGAGGMIENQEVLKQLALDKRNAGRGSTQTVYPTSKAMYDAQGGPSPFADVISGWKSQKGDALEEYRRAAFPERYADEAPSLLQQGEAAAQRDLDVIPFSNFTDKKTAAGALAATNAPDRPDRVSDSLRVQRHYDDIETAPTNEGILAAEENWRGGVADFGDPTAAIDVQNMKGYFDYRSHLEDAARRNLGEEFNTYRLMRQSQLDDWQRGADLDPLGVTLSQEFAEKFGNFAGFKGKPEDKVVVRIPTNPGAVVMRGSPEEKELVINPNEISGHTLEVLRKLGLIGPVATPTAASVFGPALEQNQ